MDGSAGAILHIHERIKLFKEHKMNLFELNEKQVEALIAALKSRRANLTMQHEEIERKEVQELIDIFSKRIK